MFRFKSLLSHLKLIIQLIVVLSTTSLVMVACTLPKSSPGNGKSSATYFVNSADISVTTQKLDPKISIPIAKTFSFKVCVKDNRLSQTIVNHRFDIETEDKTISKITDASGCLVWSEDIAYNHLAPAHYLELVRKMTAVGFQKGERDLRFSINPWENQAESLLDKNRDDLIPYKDLKMSLMGANSHSAAELSQPLWVDDLRLTVYERQISAKGLILDFLIRTSPSMVMVKSTGERVLQPLTYGEFDTEISLIHVVSENQKEVRRLMEAPVKATAVMAEGYLNIEAPITMDKICTRGQLEVGLKIIPKNAPKNLLPFEGVFIGNDCDQIKGSSFARLTNEFQEAKGGMTIDQYLTDKTLPTTPLSSGDSQSMLDPNQPDYYQRGQVEIKKLMFSNVGFKDQHTLNRQKLFNVTACMKAGLDQKGMRGQFFDVTKVNGKTEHIKSNDDGCVSWDDSYDFNFLETECWKEASVQIKNTNLGLNQTLKLHLNPWGFNDTAFRDIRFVDTQGQALYCASGKSQIVLNNYSYDKAQYDYDMDAVMGMTVKKDVLFKLTPRLRRPSLTDPSGYSEEPLPVGAYALRWAVVDMSVEDLSQARDKIQQADEKIVYMGGNSTITERLTLETADIKAVGNTNKIFIELYPLKENAMEMQRQNPKLSLEDLTDKNIKVEHTTYWGALILANNNDGTTLVPYRGDTLLSLIPRLKSQFVHDRAETVAAAQKLARKEQFAADNALVTYNLNDAAQSQNLRANLSYAHRYDPAQAKAQKGDLTPYPEAKLKKWLQTGVMDQDLMTKMCDLFTMELLSNPGNKKPVFTAKSMSDIDQVCVMAGEENLAEAFEIQYRYFVKNPVLLRDPITQKNMSDPEMHEASISTGFSFNKGITNSATTSFNKSFSIAAKGEMPFLSFISGSAGLNYSISKSHSENNGYGAQQVFSTGVSLTVEKMRAKIQTQGVEKCAMIKLGSAYFETDQQKKASLFSNIFDHFFKSSINEYAEPTATNDDIARTLSKGLLICDGEISKTPKTFVENYYIINQRMPYTIGVDPASDGSRPFFAVLRGDADMDRFMTYLEGSYTNPATGTAKDVNTELASQKLRSIFSYIPTYPGQLVRDH